MMIGSAQVKLVERIAAECIIATLIKDYLFKPLRDIHNIGIINLRDDQIIRSELIPISDHRRDISYPCIVGKPGAFESTSVMKNKGRKLRAVEYINVAVQFSDSTRRIV